MKNSLKILITIIVLLIPFIIIAQPMPWDPGVGGGTGGAPVGGGAPIGEGIILFFTMGIGYGVKKWKVYRHKK